MINTSRPTTSQTNVSRPGEGETWASITTTFATETRTWLQASKLITNISSPLYQYLLADGGYLLQENRDRIILSNGSTFTNVNRP